MLLYTVFMILTVYVAIEVAICIKGKDMDNLYFYITIMAILFITSQFLIYHVRSEKSYKQGQIDAMTNKVKYELITQPDSTKVWREKE